MQEAFLQLSVSIPSIHCCIIHMKESSHRYECYRYNYTCHTYKGGIPAVVRVTDMKESCHGYNYTYHTYKGGIPAVVRVTDMKESCHEYNYTCHTYEGGIPAVVRVYPVHPLLLHIYEGVMLHMSRSHVTHMKESCRTYEGVKSHI